jgi:hypothetical protein
LNTARPVRLFAGMLPEFAGVSDAGMGDGALMRSVQT